MINLLLAKYLHLYIYFWSKLILLAHVHGFILMIHVGTWQVKAAVEGPGYQKWSMKQVWLPSIGLETGVVLFFLDSGKGIMLYISLVSNVGVLCVNCYVLRSIFRKLDSRKTTHLHSPIWVCTEHAWNSKIPDFSQQTEKLTRLCRWPV